MSGPAKDIDAWIQDQLTAAPEWPPERYVTIRQHLEGDPPSVSQDC